jgi:hypothetical protein
MVRSRVAAARELVRRPRDLVLFARVAAFAALVPWLMSQPLPRVARLLTRPTRRGTPATTEVERLERMITLAPRLAHPVVRTGCLTRGVTLFWFLRRAGLNVELRFGLNPDDGAPADGHCWLTLDGEPILERRDPRPRFAETYRLPLPTA